MLIEFRTRILTNVYPKYAPMPAPTFALSCDVMSKLLHDLDWTSTLQMHAHKHCYTTQILP